MDTSALKALILAPGQDAMPIAVKTEDVSFGAAFGKYWDDLEAANAKLERTGEVWTAAPFVARGVHLRANAVRDMPWALYKGDDEVDSSADFRNYVKFLPHFNELLWLTEAGLTLQGRGYWFKERNRVRTLSLRWVAAETITPKIDAKEGLTGFIRKIGATQDQYAPEDFVYFWGSDPLVEVGPPTSWPAKSAWAGAGVTLALDAFIAAFFERGAIKATVLTVEGGAAPAERERLKAWWQRSLQGIRNAFATEVVNAVVKPVVIGEGVAELANQVLTQQAREDIAVALGIPMSLLLSSAVTGLGGGGVAEQDDIHFYSKTVIPECTFIAGVLNEQIFAPLGLRFAFLPETLDLYQKDESERAASLAQLTGAGVPLVLAMQILGFELPEGWDWDKLQAELDKGQAQADAIAQQTPATDDVVTQVAQTLDGQSPGGAPGDVAQEAAVAMKHLRADDAVQADMAHLKTVFATVLGAIKATRIIPDGANEPLLPVPDMVEISEADLERAAELWDELMPEYVGLLDAESVKRVPNA